MGFNALDGVRVVLHGMSNESPRVVSTKWMEALFRHGDVAYAIVYLITTQKTTNSTMLAYKLC